MSFWSVMNWVIWGANALIIGLIMKDVIKIELETKLVSKNTNIERGYVIDGKTFESRN